MTTLEILSEMRRLIASPENWKRKWFGFRSDGSRVELHSTGDPLPGATCFCLEGAYIKASGDFMGLIGHFDLFRFESCFDFYAWNDDPSRTHSEVLSRLDAAIEAERKKS